MAFGKSQTSKYYTTLRSRAFKVPTVEARRAYYTPSTLRTTEAVG